MDFKKFVELTRPVIGGKEGVHKYVRSLFDAILTEDSLDILENYSDSSYKAYANGNTQITQFAKAIVSHLSPENFASFIRRFDKPAKLELCNRFQPFLPDINKSNVGKKIAALFDEIIHEAAGVKRKSSATHKHEAEPIEAEVLESDTPSRDAPGDKKITVIQHQTNVVQNGENNINLTNNGTMNFNF